MPYASTPGHESSKSMPSVCRHRTVCLLPHWMHWTRRLNMSSGPIDQSVLLKQSHFNSWGSMLIHWPISETAPLRWIAVRVDQQGGPVTGIALTPRPKSNARAQAQLHSAFNNENKNCSADWCNWIRAAGCHATTALMKCTQPQQGNSTARVENAGYSQCGWVTAEHPPPHHTHTLHQFSSIQELCMAVYGSAVSGDCVLSRSALVSSQS